MKQNEIPMGFSMALAKNPEAMQIFATLSENEKKKVIDGTHSINSKEEMNKYVSSVLKASDER